MLEEVEEVGGKGVEEREGGVKGGMIKVAGDRASGCYVTGRMNCCDWRSTVGKGL